MLEHRILRLLGAAVVAALSATVVAQGLLLRRVSRRLEQVAAAQAAQDEEPPRRPAAAGAPLLRLDALAALPASAGPATTDAARVLATGRASATLLREALATAEGREQLKATLASLKEEKRQERVAARVEKREQKDRTWRDHVLALRSLTPAEAQKVTTLFARLEEDRRRVLESMRGGHLGAREADDANDDLARALKKTVRTLLGEQRWKELKDEERRLGRDRDLAAAEGQPAPSP
jgi:hypothetical protein